MASSKSPSLPKRIVVVLLLALLIFATLAFFKFRQIQGLIASGSIAPPPTPVTAMVAQSANFNPRIQAVGSLVAYEGVLLTSETSGVVTEVSFESGEQVEKEQLLFKLDDSSEQAALQSARVALNAADAQYNRSQKLLDERFVSQNDIEQLRAARDLARAQLQSAQVALNKKNITAPFAGTAGIRQVGVGDLVSPGAPLVNLQNITKLYLDFTLPEKQLSALRVDQQVNFVINNGEKKQYNAHVMAWDPSLDTVTRTVSVRAAVDNVDGKLYPGMFVEVELVTDQQQQVVVIPETAIFYNIYGEAVFVLNKPEPDPESAPTQESANNNDKQQDERWQLVSRQVEIAYRKDGKVGVLSGVEAGEQVVTAGQNKLFNGMDVAITDDVPPFDGQPNAAPKEAGN